MTGARGKRLVDLVGAGLGLVVGAPLLLAIAVAVRWDDGGPVWFRQARIGRGGRPFTLWKFRTMRPGAGGRLVTVAGDARVTRVGRFLRRHKLDELPQLWNVLRGEMSLVGPRPEVARYVARYTEEQRRVLALVPGLTGPASIAFVDEEGWLAAQPDPEAAYLTRLMPEKIRLNLAYATRATVISDLALMLRTVAAVRQRKPNLATQR